MTTTLQSLGKKPAVCPNHRWPASEQLAYLRSVIATAFMPSQPMAPDEWADGRITLSRRSGSRITGPLRLDRTPYMRGLLRAFLHYRKMWLLMSAQTGKTTIQQCLLGYCVDQDPGPFMFVYPSKDSAKRRSSKHLIPMLEESPALARHMSARSDDTQLFQYILDTMTVNLGWAGSATMLASEPVRYLFCDESAKFKHLDKSEAHPIKLAEARTKSYDELARIVHATTPTLDTSHGWAEWLKSTMHEYHVPCTACGKPADLADVPALVIDPAAWTRDGISLADRLKAAGYQVLRWENIRWNNDLAEVEAKAASARYVCEYCGHPHEFSAVLPMTRLGKWIPTKPTSKDFGARMPSWYRGDVKDNSWVNAVRNFLLAAGDPELLQDHLNNDRCEPWRELGQSKNADEILMHRRPYAPETLPFVPVAIFLTVDIRATEIHFVIRAWGPYETSALVRYGVLPRLYRAEPGVAPTGESLSALDALRDLTFPAPDGHRYGLDLTSIDAPYDRDEVYAYCRTRTRCVAIQGEHEDLKQPLSYSRAEKDPVTGEAREDSAFLITVASSYFKDALFNKLAIPPGPWPVGNPGEWMLHAEVGNDYVQHLTAESKIEKKNSRGRVKWIWHLWHKRNHWLDCEYHQVVLARFAGVRDMQPPSAPVATGPTQEEARYQVMGRDASGFARRLTQ